MTQVDQSEYIVRGVVGKPENITPLPGKRKKLFNGLWSLVVKATLFDDSHSGGGSQGTNMDGFGLGGDERVG